MHHTFVRPASAVTLASFLSTALSGVAPRQGSNTGGFTCTDDALYKGFFSNSQISYDVQTFCSSELELPDSTVCDHSLTTRKTVYPSASSHTITATATTTSYETTVTVTETGTAVLDLSKKIKARNAAPAPQASITAAPKVVRDVLAARAVEKRQNTTSFNGENAAAQVHSACECGYLAGIITADTDYVATCYPYTLTVTNNVDVYQATTTTAFTTLEAAVTTITITQNQTSNILSVISAMNTSSTPVWTGPWTGVWSESWTEWSGQATVPPTFTSNSTTFAPTTTASISMTSTTNSSVSGVITPGMLSTSTVKTWVTTTMSTIPSSTVAPSGCPWINGTTYTVPGSCNVYTRVCGLSFETPDFYGAFPYFPSPELCAGLCDADSDGMSPCLGIVWNTSATAGSHQSNCGQLQTTNDPIMDPTAIALILTGQDPSCNKDVNISTFTTTSMSMNKTIDPVSPTDKSSTSFDIPTTTGSQNRTWSPTGTWNGTRSWPTGTGYPHSHNYTRTSTLNSTMLLPYMPSTTSSSNITTIMTSHSRPWSTGTAYHNHDHNYTHTSSTGTANHRHSSNHTRTSWTSMNTTSSGTGTISPIMTSNSTCPVSTIISVSTHYATLFNNITVMPVQSTITIYATNISTVTVTATDTSTTTK